MIQIIIKSRVLSSQTTLNFKMKMDSNDLLPSVNVSDCPAIS
jgi:hypothetical protein